MSWFGWLIFTIFTLCVSGINFYLALMCEYDIMELYLFITAVSTLLQNIVLHTTVNALNVFAGGEQSNAMKYEIVNVLLSVQKT